MKRRREKEDHQVEYFTLLQKRSTVMHMGTKAFWTYLENRPATTRAHFFTSIFRITSDIPGSVGRGMPPTLKAIKLAA